MDHKRNAFDILRILLAVCVMVTHGLMIGGYKLQDPLNYFSKGQTDLAEFGVMGFFALSGYLITASFERTSNIFVYVSHRALRILPAFWVCLLITAFIFVPAIFHFSGRPLSDYKFTGDDSATRYVIKNFWLKIEQWGIRGALDHSAYQGSVNGSLWSLYPELQCYAFTLCAGITGLFKKNKYLYLIIATMFFMYFAIHLNFSTQIGPTIFTLSPAMKLYATYIAGTLVYTFRDQLILDKKGTLFLVVFTLIVIRFGGFKLVSPVLIAMVLINAFQLFEFKLRYDISYGVYIYGFVIQQLLFVIFENRFPPALFIILAIALSAVMGIMSFVLIERPFMNLRKAADGVLRKIANP